MDVGWRAPASSLGSTWESFSPSSSLASDSSSPAMSQSLFFFF
jgi:hypothetical protein